MLRWYGYLGIALLAFAQVNFFAVIQPFATWYIPIVWTGFILFVDSLVYAIARRSLISAYPGEMLFMALLSIPVWSVFEVYNVFTMSWHYVNYVWYVHFVDFAVIVPSFMETLSLLKVLGIGRRFDVRKRLSAKGSRIKEGMYRNIIKLLVAFGALATVLPLLLPTAAYAFVWFGLFLLLDPLNYLIGRPSFVNMICAGRKSLFVQTVLAGLATGFFYEFWNYMAYPKWLYAIPVFSSGMRLFEMPLPGYLGYISFTAEAFLLFALARSFVFKKSNDLLYA
ncbi:MAG: hypothetical protein KGH72_01480 [Candidatus Micrarchaeota archaeon]|nr:hypothetical protein [Candidatus Micrarchaeota archaeon]